jgi:hypothetical protein
MESNRKKEGQTPNNEWKDVAQRERLHCFTRELEKSMLEIEAMLSIPLFPCLLSYL